MRAIGIIIITLFFQSSLHAQHVISAGSHTTSTDEMQVAYTVGEAVIQTVTNQYILTQGFHQPFHYTVTAIQPADEPQVAFAVYPNPVSDKLFIAGDAHLKGNYTCQLTTIQGTLLPEVTNNLQVQAGQEYWLDMSSLAPGTYLLTIQLQGPTPTQSVYRIVKAAH